MKRKRQDSGRRPGRIPCTLYSFSGFDRKAFLLYNLYTGIQHPQPSAMGFPLFQETCPGERRKAVPDPLHNKETKPNEKTVDVHVHVGLRGDRWPHWGRFSPAYQKQIPFQVFLLYGRLKPSEVNDQNLRDATLNTIASSKVPKVVCLALDPVYDETGARREDLSHFWVDNEYIVQELMPKLPDRILLGASAHPYDRRFQNRVKRAVHQGAVLVKWLPSAQQINLADERVREALIFLAKAKGGKPLPLLLHAGPEYAIPTMDPRAKSFDFLTWSKWESFVNFFRFGRRWNVPQVEKIRSNLQAALNQGAVIIFAHCGAAYFLSGSFVKLFEHSDLAAVREYLERSRRGEFSRGGRCYADLSAFCTPARRKYFSEIKTWPEELLLYGSDFPTPAFELSRGKEEVMEDFKAVLKGHLDRIIVPEDNLLDVNHGELKKYFPGHKMFTNFNQLI